ncbi:MurR/RpiR family transcriptional regulator [Phytohabitans suffuscus]|uniref:N-acetylmannosamine kinase n=1 Tax=Phytohabitans suffuscus TaxID=624315 RepID=A0A6F8YEK6_9ACTN|nr:MurR/RpiR family transcriptional regulator [Phytohabitans suffuscus]BCB84536.1 N-acetylmannosamine kinase [Phytohabitans suffuscus]
MNTPVPLSPTDADVPMSLPERVRLKHDLLSESQRKVARFCLAHPDEAGELTALRIADRIRVSESTVVRFAIRLGYRGFPDMQADLRSSLALRAHATPSTVVGRNGDGGQRVARSLAADVESLRDSVEALSLDRVCRVADLLYAANRIVVVGFRTSFSVAHLAAFHLKRVHPAVALLDDLGGEFDDDLDQLREDDAVLAISFPRYDGRTLKAIDAAARLSVPVVVITDSVLSPVGDMPHAIFVGHHGQSFFNSTVAATAVVNAIVVRLVERRSQEDPSFEHGLVERFHAELGGLRPPLAGDA